jgi:phospholipid-binding lipoprotein MlaA
MNGFSSLVLAAIVLGVSGCATSPSPDDSRNDPLESVNRLVFRSNESFDRNFARPAAVFYNDNVPEPARDGLHNVLVNLGLPTTFANDVLQGEVTRGGETLERFAVNSTIGVAGIIDAATKYGIPEHHSDFGETLALYGADEGCYLMLPVLGPSTVRDLVGTAADTFLDPTAYVGFRGSVYFKFARGGAKIFDDRARNVETFDDIERSSVDMYATVRSLYLQHRRAQINRGKPDVKDLPDF